ncbi:Adenosylmethionine-8-amino-7-oxononanoate aminotransferase [Sulfobacillus thermosulfidooxidans DSM 9293]|uniref:Adenosylmethionine-8-amino-7-oxononanoate aminotransferase n=1 Tax=Sulfobacillus thermosulfidooxidans (strain DSM 9293 / VKM B-1269 / AT-1) TaxID=929705 RepID=A0A1W1WCQ4_SULTA|nr:aspartate aminotransferase family protein [Sulfobacillus thermosulfidooxidans]SMC03972.1 Adenosylmethionine-8-amino-7-oxononanoate aminotransferase [Sulfobacillus thermosulfidooxidans DSM 9293]
MLSRWGPYTNMRMMTSSGPIVIDHAQGVYVWDESGKKYLDAHAGLWLANVGYGRAEIHEAIGKQAEKLSWFSSFGGFANRPSLDLAERLQALFAPENMATVFFSNDGSEAVETALKLSREYWKLMGKPGKTKLIGRQYAYHGVTMGALSVAGITPNRRLFEPLLADARHAPAPYRNHCTFHPGDSQCTMACARELERIIQFEGPDTVAAFIAEPVQAAGGVIFPPADYLAQVRSICQQYDVLFIADEVVTGFGRLGEWSGSRYYHIQPDMMTFAKGITSGYLPLGATAVSAPIFEVFLQNSQDRGPEFRHGNTYSGHPLACAAALANIDLIEKEDLLSRAQEQGRYLNEQLQKLVREFSEDIVDAQCEGLLGRVELHPHEGQAAGIQGEKVSEHMKAQGVIVRPVGDVLTLSPPLIITRQEIDEIIFALHETLAGLKAAR